MLDHWEKNGQHILYIPIALPEDVYPDLMQSLEAAAFLSSPKKFIARPGRSERLYSDKGWTFVGAAKRIRAVMKE